VFEGAIWTIRSFQTRWRPIRRGGKGLVVKIPKALRPAQKEGISEILRDVRLITVLVCDYDEGGAPRKKKEGGSP
jgi:hypothetical protein